VKAIISVLTAYNAGRFSEEKALFADVDEKLQAFEKMANFGVIPFLRRSTDFLLRF